MHLDFHPFYIYLKQVFIKSTGREHIILATVNFITQALN